MHDKTVGIIGMGAMGKMYARRIAAAGWRFVSDAHPCRPTLILSQGERL